MRLYVREGELDSPVPRCLDLPHAHRVVVECLTVRVPWWRHISWFRIDVPTTVLGHCEAKLIQMIYLHNHNCLFVGCLTSQQHNNHKALWNKILLIMYCHKISGSLRRPASYDATKQLSVTLKQTTTIYYVWRTLITFGHFGTNY